MNDPARPYPASPPLKILHLEDDPNDALLVRDALEGGDRAVDITLVNDEAGYRSALATGSFDLILSDYNLPDINGMQALALTRESHPDLPFIFVTGTIGEELATEAARSGANHYILKNRLYRLPPAVHSALRESETLAARRRAERALRENDAVTVQLMNIAPDPILIQSEGRIRYLNASLRRLLGVGPHDDLLGRPLLDFVCADERKQMRLGLRSQRGEQQELAPHHQYLRRLDGSRVSVEISSVPTAFQGHAGVLVIIRNISERQQLEERTRQAQKMEVIGRLAGGIAHDFNNILTVINGYAELLLAGRSEADPDRLPLEEIRTAGERAASLTRQLLAFSRRQVIAPQTIDLNDSVRGMEGMLRRLIGEEIELALAPAAAPVFALADPGQMEQVIMNLVVNARDAISRSGRITLATGRTRNLPHKLLSVALRPPDGWARLSVNDTGAGMDTEVMHHIFEPFFTTKAQGTGTGLGMATVFAIVQGAGGQIEVQSKPGRGSTVTIYLPSVPAASPAMPVPPPPTVGPDRRKGITILLAEDEGALRMLAEKVLSQAGYRVLAAPDGASALRLLTDSGEAITLLLSDVVMPGMSGPELAGQARGLRPGLPILYMSGYNDDEILKHGITSDSIGFLQKPYTPRQLLEAIERMLPK